MIGPGTVISLYEIERQMGETPLAWTFRATKKDGKDGGEAVIIRVFRDERWTDGEDRKKLETSFDLPSNTLMSPNPKNLVRPLSGVSMDVIDEKLHAFVVREWVEGKSLREKIAAGPLPLDEVKEIARQACEGLRLLHKVNFVHGGICPENIFWTDKGVVRLTDFGISLTSLEEELTEEKIGKQRWAYAAPEQCFPATNCPTPAADIYSLGAVLCEMLTGRLPGDDLADIDPVLQKALETEPTDRYEYVEQFAEAIDKLAEDNEFNDRLQECSRSPLPTKDNELNPVVGIDLGTTHCCIARWDGREPRIYEGIDRMMGTQIRSVVYVEKDGDIWVGSMAHKRYLMDPENGVTQIQREMGNRDFRVSLRGKEYTPVEISSFILRKIADEVRKRYPASYKFDFGGVVVAHPYYFKAPQIADTRAAAERAGLNLLGLIPAPVAALLPYALYHWRERLEEGNPLLVLIFDLGGGTFDTTLFRLREDPDKLVFQVLSTGGDARLGGEDFDEAFISYVCGVERLDLAKLSRRAKGTLRDNVESAKRELSVFSSAYIAVPNILPGQHIDREVTRKEFERVMRGDFDGAPRNYAEHIRGIVRSTLEQGGSPKVDRIIMVGGSSRIPLMEDILREVVSGAEIYRNVSESLVVALGASIYAAVLDHRIDYKKEIVIHTVSSHAIGIGTRGDKFSKIIQANSPAPCEASRVFTTPRDNCPELEIGVYQGEGEKTSDRGVEKIGSIRVSGLPEHRKGEVEIKVTFQVSLTQEISVRVEVFTSQMRKDKIEELNEKLKLR